MPDPIVHVPAKDKWEFDAEVTDVFEDMLQRSIPQYEVMRTIVTDLAARFIVAGGHVVDLGCSRGDAIARLLMRAGAGLHYAGIEVSPPMLEVARERFRNHGMVSILDYDLRRPPYPFKADSVCCTLSVLTLQFIPIEYRQRLLWDIYRSTKPGGALLMVEKVLGETAQIDQHLVDMYYALKGQNGYSQMEIERKRLSLEGVLVPVTARWNEELLRSAGFQQVDCFWRCLNFVGWLAVRQ